MMESATPSPQSDVGADSQDDAEAWSRIVLLMIVASLQLSLAG